MFGALDDLAHDAVTGAGYLGLIAIMIVENLFPPIPSEIVLPLAGYEVSRGELTFVGTVAAATLGSLIGAWILYAVGRYGGRPAVERWGRFLRIGPNEIDQADAWFTRWGSWVVLVARMIPGARSVVSLPAGMMHMSLLRFTVLTTIGSLVWNALLIGIGWQLGANWEDISDRLGGASRVVVIAAVIGLAGLFVAHQVRRRRRSV